MKKLIALFLSFCMVLICMTPVSALSGAELEAAQNIENRIKALPPLAEIIVGDSAQMVLIDAVYDGYQSLSYEQKIYIGAYYGSLLTWCYLSVHAGPLFSDIDTFKLFHDWLAGNYNQDLDIKYLTYKEILDFYCEIDEGDWKEFGHYYVYDIIHPDLIEADQEFSRIGGLVLKWTGNCHSIALKPWPLETVYSLEAGYENNIVDEEKLKEISAVTGRFSTFQVGDIDLDGQRNISDVVALRSSIMSGEDQIALNDIDNDGKANVSDIVFLRQKIMLGDSVG